MKNEIIDKLDSIKSYSGKVKYLNNNLRRLGSGSGRIAYDLGDDKVIKLAKNIKGVAQNEVEIGVGVYADDYSLFTKIYEHSDDNIWIVAEKAKKVSEKRIKELTGINNLYTLGIYIRKAFNNSPYLRLDDAEIEFLDNNDFAQELLDFIGSYQLNGGDLNRPSTYGEVIRNGEPMIVVVDYGINNKVINKYYSKNRMYELYNSATGNDDILNDIDNGEFIRKGMWALMPDSVNDPYEIDESVINLILSRNSYPNRPIQNIGSLVDIFYDCMYNIRHILSSIKDYDKFYRNLMVLQKYLYENNAINRGDVLISENEIPDVKSFTLTDREYATKLVNSLSDKLGLSVGNYLGGGSNGFAFELLDGRVIKISSDVGEADAASRLLRVDAKYIADVYNLYKVVDSEENLSFFVIIEENIDNKPIDLFKQYNKVVDMIKPDGMDYVDLLIRMKKNFNKQELINIASKILVDNDSVEVSDELRRKTYEYIVGLIHIKEELLKYGIKSNDYSNIENIGYSNGQLKYFDFGGYRSTEPNVGGNVVSLPENEDVSGYDPKYLDLADRIVSKLGYETKPIYIGSGDHGHAFAIGDNLVLKITTDISEVDESIKLMKLNLKYTVKPHKIFKVNDNIYCIILDRLVTNESIVRTYNRLKYVFNNILNIELDEAIEFKINGYKYGSDVDFDKIDKYLSKNFNDRKFFDSLVNIGKELDLNGISSLDYYNPKNLGYDANGILKFFDVGSGDYKVNSLNKMMVEDGTSLYSSDDGFNNEVIPNTYSDLLEGVGGIIERIVSSMTGSQTVYVKNKCRLGANTSKPCNQGDINNFKFTKISEELNAKECLTRDGAIRTVIEGKRDVGITQIDSDELINLIISNDLGLIKIPQTHHNVGTSIIYRKTSSGIRKAQRLYSIMMSKGGYVSDETPEEAREIGELLGYSKNSIDDYVKRIYVLDNGKYRRRTNDELIVYDDVNGVKY